MSETIGDSETDELTLISRSKVGDRECFGLLVENHAGRAFRIAFSILQNRSDAEDVVQESFITAYKSLKKLQNEASFAPWLARIVTTRSYDHLRQSGRQHKVIDRQSQSIRLGQTETSADISEESEEFGQDLYAAIDKLPEPHRLIIKLRYGEDMSTEDIAKTIGRPAGTVRRMLSESYRLLRLHLEGDDQAP